MDYEEKLTVYHSMFHPFGLSYANQVELENLLALIFNSLRTKDPSLKLVDLFNKLIKDKNVNVSDDYIERTCIHIECIMRSTSEMFVPDSYGFQTPKDIVARIITILNSHVPF